MTCKNCGAPISQVRDIWYHIGPWEWMYCENHKTGGNAPNPAPEGLKRAEPLIESDFVKEILSKYGE
jgi:hypothetical protein